MSKVETYVLFKVKLLLSALILNRVCLINMVVDHPTKTQ